MPITPLHFGLMAPASSFWPGRVNWIPFVLTNLWIDAPSIMAAFSGEPLPGHEDWGHTFVGATLVAVLVGMVWVRSWPWVLGAFLGAWSHIVLDMLVHSDMSPLRPMHQGNPFYLGIMGPLSWVLTPLTVWFIAQVVSSSLAKARRALRRAPESTPKADA